MATNDRQEIYEAAPFVAFLKFPLRFWDTIPHIAIDSCFVLKIAVNTRLLLAGRLDGIGWYTYETLRRITEAHPEHEFHFLFDRAFDPKFIFSKNVQGHIIPPPTRHPLLYILWFEIMLPMWFKSHKPDLFLSPDGMLSLNSRIPQLAVIHDINFEHRPMDLPFSYRTYYRKSFPRFAHKASRIHTVSHYSKSDLVTTYGIDPEKIDVGCNGANAAYRPLTDTEKKSFRNKFTHGSPYFIFIGNFHQRKNVHGILNAFAEFSKKYPQYKLALTGKQFWAYPEMREALKNCDPEKLIWTGRLDVDQLALALGASEALLFPSFFEGFGIPILEAFAGHVPVITSRLTSMPEIAGEAALYCDPTDPLSIAASMEQIITRPDLAIRLCQLGELKRQRYSWEIAAQALDKSINRILEKKS